MSDTPVVRTEALPTTDGGVVPRFTLSITEGPDTGADFGSAADGATVVGTSEGVTVRLRDTAVSRFHCELAPVPGGLAVRDLGSRNGTWAGGMQLRDAVVPFGTVLSIGRTRMVATLRDEVGQLPIAPTSRFGQLVGASQAMRHVFAMLARAAQSDVTVLLTGETGTGKEAAAQSIHEESPRKGHPLVVVDCASVPSNLFESELFGHERGAFTSAHAAREGAFEMADGGTLFIDEIGELSLDLQPKLLRVLEQREVKRVGGGKSIPVDVRIVAATHRDLRAEVNAKRFRADLYYRLAVMTIRMPALRERSDDLPLLVESLSGAISTRLGLPTDPLRDPTFLQEIARHAWPGNVRELRNYLERALVLGGAARPEAEQSAASEERDVLTVDVGQPLRDERDRVVAALERAYLDAVLKKTSGNVTRAAQMAGVDRVHFYRLLARHGLRREA